MTCALEQQEPVAIFFDFEAAFPSLEQRLIHQLLRRRGWPAGLLRFVQVLYQNNFCDISLGGCRFAGFHLTRGVRQGLPSIAVSLCCCLGPLHPALVPFAAACMRPRLC